jgi:hypothetical protein
MRATREDAYGYEDDMEIAPKNTYMVLYEIDGEYIPVRHPGSNKPIEYYSITDAKEAARYVKDSIKKVDNVIIQPLSFDERSTYYRNTSGSRRRVNKNANLEHKKVLNLDSGKLEELQDFYTINRKKKPVSNKTTRKSKPIKKIIKKCKCK